MTEPVVLFAPIGPYTDPIAQLIWALYRRKNQAVVEAHVVVDQRARFYLDAELLRPGGQLEHLRRKLGPAILGPADVKVIPAAHPSGALLTDDLLPEHRAIYLDAMWTAARAAIASAGPRRVIFGLLAGRRRTITAYQTSLFQLLARRDDQLLDVRVSDPRVHDHEFFFPEQGGVIEAGPLNIDPLDVDVLLVDVALPKLAGLIAAPSLASFSAALAAGQRAIDAAALPVLTIDLAAGRAEVDGETLDLSAAELLWYGHLAVGRGEGDGWVEAGRDGHPAFRRFLDRLAGRPWVQAVRTRPLLQLMAGEEVDDEDLRNLRGKVGQRVKRWCEGRRPGLLTWLQPETGQHRHQRIPLSPERIVVRAPEG